MSIPERFIQRPIATTLVMMAILLFGIASYRVLPVSDLPNVDYPTISVNANLPGANPDTMAAAVALPLEKQFSNIAGLDSMISSNRVGATSIVLQFNLDRNLDGAAQDVQAAISQAARQLPPGMPAPPSYYRQNPADYPVLFLALTSDTLELSAVDEYAETYIAPSVSTVNGVALVQIYGQFKYAPHIQLDPEALATRRIGIDDVENALTNGNVNLPTGTIWGSQRAPTVQTQGQLYNAADYSKLIVAYRNGSPVRLSDLGRVVDSVQNDKNVNFFYDADLPRGISAIPMVIFKQPGTNAVQVVNGIKAMLPRLESTLPPSVKMRVLFDRSVTVRNSVDDVKFTLELALFLVIMVIFLFLRNLSATTIPSLALPFSLVGTFAVMYVFGYSIDNLSLMALTLSVGFVVDDAIVMLENIVRHMEQGESAMAAAINGSEEIGFTIISMTLSLSAVFIPVLFMGGVIGRLLHEFAVTIMAAILVSGFVSLTLTPMLCSRFLKPHHEIRHGRLYNFFESMQVGLERIYDRCLRVVLRHKLATMLFSASLVVGTYYLAVIIPKGFLPSEDIDQINGTTEAIEGISFNAMVEHQRQICEILVQDPSVDYVLSSIGSGGRTLNQGGLNIRLKPRSERPQVDQVINELRPKLAAVPGMVTFLRNDPPIRIGGLQSKALYQFTMQSPKTSELYSSAQDFTAKMRALPGLTDVSSDLQIRNPQINIEIDRDAASSYGVSVNQIEDAIYSAYGQRQISTIFAPNNQYWVILELEPEYQRDANKIASLYVHSVPGSQSFTSASGQLVPISAVAKLSSTLGPLSVNHLGQLPAVTVSFNLKAGTSIGDAVAEISDLARQALPPTTTTTFQGNAQAFQSSLAGLGVLLAMAILVIYIILGILYESFLHPITILSGLPSAGFGALLSLYLFHTAATKGWISPLLDMNLDIYGFVGIMMLIGIVKKNAIMMIDFALEAQRKEGKSPTEAIYQGCLVRFRPIMMTTMAALMGTLPIALGIGAGGEARRPLGVSVVGGLAFSQVVTLFLTPVFYIYMEDAKQWGARIFAHMGDAESEPHSSSSGTFSTGPVGPPVVRSKDAPEL
ncbi:MAG TPA: efflux RND transporter permease subunit [Candidatus Acidoferrales bacterium]|nr:efflux RND transporter permease subunit [Candidatus Acidoferrales bacterium]